MKIWKFVVSQFGKPEGLFGKLAGFIMSTRPSNIERGDWGISLLDVQPTDNILEIGFGPGIAIHKMSALTNKGMIYGIDHSELMYKQATKTNTQAIEQGKVKLFHTSVATLPPFEKQLDKILDVNSFQFWEQPIEWLTALRAVMSEDGVIALVHQPRKPGATEADSEQAGQTFSAYLTQAGFHEITIERKPIKPVSVICILGKNVPEQSHET
jgi:ubiquinone/menaquinone biosynthesis C-methylase UbiE